MAEGTVTVAVKALDVFFRRIEPEQVLRRIFTPYPTPFEKLFLTMSEGALTGYSREEQENIYRFFQPDKPGAELPPFQALLQYADSVLMPGRDGPMCCLEQVLSWREAYLLLGQDIFTTAYLANGGDGNQPVDWFSWPATIPVNDPVLKRITTDLAENHMHLYAGASTFALTWCCLMNHPYAILKRGGALTELLQAREVRSVTGELWTLERRTIYAAFLRAVLFSRLQGSRKNTATELRRFCAQYSTDEIMCGVVGRRIDCLRFIYGLSFPQPGSIKGVCLDYAFTSQLERQKDEPSRLLAGERLFLYGCFHACFFGEFTYAEQWMFYLYLLLKAQFRGELVQVNGRTGFHNFNEYDDRKSVLWKKDYPEYLNEDYRQALNAPLSRQGGVASLEARITPESTAWDDLEKIYRIDRAYLHHEALSFLSRWSLDRWRVAFHTENRAKDSGHFYVIHFPKKQDNPLKSHALPVCRHKAFREDLRRDAEALAFALSNSEYIAERIRGIDACANEIGCRPEVFAPAFRFLRAFPIQQYRLPGAQRSRPRLGITYHVGEDFLDIADGLRAIDEATRFLGMQRGDRLGHVLALGVDPELHYVRKSRQTIMPKQDLLDNLVWLNYRSVELDVEMAPNLRSRLQQKAESLFDELYGCYLTQAAALSDYYHSMLLRGDEPQSYYPDKLKRIVLPDAYSQFALNDDQDLLLPRYRSQPKLCELYRLYHYSRGVKQVGAQLEIFDITEEYIQLMADMQRGMRRYIGGLGLGLECNPSSNVLIGTFGRYQKHPVLNFYNQGLGLPQAEEQMHVSINSDDPGVFDTTLAFEFALLSGALREMTDEKGKRINSDRAIEEYLRALVRMGREQSFRMRR